jgi:ATP-dependent DNA helicase RecQ
MIREEAEKRLRALFGLECFHERQWEVIERVLRGERVLLIEKTGFGKSLCYQFPATQMAGLTIVFSPLIALMRDQVGKLKARGIAAECLNSSQSPDENRRIMEAARAGELKILYIAPERLEIGNWLYEARQLKMAMVVIDEAHCISTWGHDFRPSYRRIVDLVNMLPDHFPVLAVTATATPKVEEDIISQIREKITSLRGNLMRPNLRQLVIEVDNEDQKMVWLAEHIHKIQGTGIIYAGTQASTETYANWLRYMGINAVAYHAGLETEQRRQIEAGLLTNQYKCVVSTNALGMGIDKPDIRFVMHTQIPQSPIHYYQEIGRAGRDGNPGIVILFFNAAEDLRLPISFIENCKPSREKYDRVVEVLQSGPLGLHGLVRGANVNTTQATLIKTDLIEQGIVEEFQDGQGRKYHLKRNAPAFDHEHHEALRNAKWADLEQMQAYVQTRDCRMKFLCDFLGDQMTGSCGNCDICRNRTFHVDDHPESENCLEAFKESTFPTFPIKAARTTLCDGIAASTSSNKRVLQAVLSTKTIGATQYPDFVAELAFKALRSKCNFEKFDLILFLPSSKSGEALQHLAKKLGGQLGIPVASGIVRVKTTRPQSGLASAILRSENVKGAFRYDGMIGLENKSILLIDDICETGSTLKEVARVLTLLGAAKITPLVLVQGKIECQLEPATH